MTTMTSAPHRLSSEIRRQLADLDLVKVAAEAYGVRDFASQLQMESILGHREELLAELRAAEQAELGQQRSVRLIGALIGGDIEAGHFSLRVGDDLYTGDVADTAKAEMRKVSFGANVEAEVEVATVSVPSRSDSQPHYVLRSVNAVVGS